MELVYLWVEKYKNIKKQGFNFSPRFDCKYDGENLTINEKKDYVSIFPDNINITAIVGENGSGKSSLIEMLMLKKVKNHFSIFMNKDDIFIYNKIYINKIKINSLNKTNKIMNYKNSKNISKKLSFIYFDTSYKEFISNSIINISSLDSVKNSDYLMQDALFLLEQKGIQLPKEFPKIDKIEIIAFNNNSLKSWIEGVSSLLQKHYSGKVDINSFISILKKIELNVKSNKLIVNLNQIPKNFFKIYQNIIEYDISRNNKEGISIIFPLQFKFQGLSAGQETFLFQFAKLYQVLRNKKIKEDIIFCIDEGDNTLHPNWQKRYINYMIDFFTDNFKDKKMHIILSSHSPFILSDLPKENVIFLEKGIQKYPFKDKQTFGANIHTLLSDGFFMSEGLMGEFAKGKIDDVIKYLKKEESVIQTDEEAKNIIDIIGEPILKNTLMTMYDEKIYSKESKLDKLNRKKLQLKKEIKKLEEKTSE